MKLTSGLVLLVDGLDLLHEAGEVLELGPLVVDHPDGRPMSICSMMLVTFCFCPWPPAPPPPPFPSDFIRAPGTADSPPATRPRSFGPRRPA